MDNKVLLLILDGFGMSGSTHGNAIAAADTPNYDKFYETNPHARLITSGTKVGLPDGVMGNSEVGHLNMGAGRIVYQLNSLIDKKISEGEFFSNQALLKAIDHSKKNRSKLHLFGLLSDGNVHSHNTHLWAVLEFCKKQGQNDVFFHAFMDGRDTLPHSGIGFIKEFMEKAGEIGVGRIATISGRYYAMDRDNRWERIERAYQALVFGNGDYFDNPVSAVQSSYDKGITDEFIIPTVITENDKPVAVINDNDAVIFFNYRADRARQITRSFIFDDFQNFQTHKFKNLKFVSFSEYDQAFNTKIEVAFRLQSLSNILGEVVSNNGLNQLRLAETEKYAHVTFFFNGGKEDPFQNEDRILVPSPKVATYDLQPEMSAYIVKDKLLEALRSGKYSLIITNFANCDMVGHTGIFDAAVKAVETIDKCLQEIIPICKQLGFSVVLTADHGNAESMLDENGNIMTAHSTNDVPVVVSLSSNQSIHLKNGVLSDIAPTILNIMGIPKPNKMTGNTLF
ncbi:MAG: 2,3-bisphosphoglycerate-independent phosphoglycerate mutase [Candidatus Cloacimonetes bacterium]|nr:2,3-bisphosphoglycerate-independent phosphoglycerate mutase [Candidatus Cloacimonadota bacterium]